MVQVLTNTGSLLGRIGKGLGQGLSEQLPKEIERHRLSSGLKKLGENQENMTPFQQLAALSSLPGGKELAPTALPLIQQQQAQRALKERSSSAKNFSSNQHKEKSTIPMESRSQDQIIQDRKSGFASPSEIKKYKSNLVQEPSQDQINDVASEMISQGLTQDHNEARRLADAEIRQNIASQNKKNLDFQQDFDKRFSLDLQKGGLGNFQDVAGEIQKDLIDQGEYLVNAKGVSPQAASQEMSKIATELGKTANSLKESGSFMNMFRPSSVKTRELKEQKKEFEKYGFGEQFNNMASASLGITRLQAAHVLDPVKNEKTREALSGLKRSGYDIQKSETKILDKIIKSIEPKDNILSIAYDIRSKHRDVPQFLERISELSDSGEIALTDRQKRELKSPESGDFLGDLLYEIF